MPKHIIMKFPLPPTSLDPLEVSARQEDQIWCLNIISRVEITSVHSMQNELRLHGPMHIL